ncbi:DsbA family protein [Nocardioides jishulii]|uniref:DsbA family protein n=1 Tax=Nocardioides jishulii TaxID=2575440 RepID=A0A4U2YJL0_9ACTN|nr:thioredoxin domain-containing protein [Nocardioides jishulii]QCX26873.1 DsbA family protein [Nocardioides jishulii]TKI61356.1 DsbA family protein [Nocardioides jishulii]
MAKNPPKKNTPGSRADERATTAAKREARREKAARQAAALKKAQQARQRKERLLVGGIVGAVLLVIVGVVAWQISRNSGPVAIPDNATDKYGVAVGKADAETQVDIYADFLCPACKTFEGATDEPLSQLAEAGTARVVYNPVSILNEYSDRAANAFAVVLDTAGADVALEFQRALFAEQPGEGGAMPDDDWLIDLAVESGAKESEIRDDIEDMKYEKWVKEATQEAERRGLRGTPTIFINDTQLEPQEALTQIQQLAQASGGSGEEDTN